jgi:hypothetical protein
MDEYEEISNSLDRLVESLRLFVRKEESREEMSCQIHKEITHMLPLGKRVGGKVAEDIRALAAEALIFIGKNNDPETESTLIERCLALKNDLWEL